MNLLISAFLTVFLTVCLHTKRCTVLILAVDALAKLVDKNAILNRAQFVPGLCTGLGIPPYFLFTDTE